MSKKKKHSEFVIWVNYILFRFGTWILRVLPLHAAYFVGHIAVLSVRLFDRRHYCRAVTHILHCGIRTERKDALKLANANFLHIFKVFVEIIKFDQIVNEKNFYEHIRIGNDAAAMRLLSPESTFPIILATAHIGNWELAGGTHSKYSGIGMTSIGRILANRRIGEYFFRKRSTFNHHSFPKDKGIRPFLAAFKDGRNLTIVADQHCVSSEGVEVTFFGHPARAHATPALLHLKTGLPISMPFLIRADDDFHFEFYTEEPFSYTPTGDKEKDVRTIAQLYTDMIERAVRRFPEQWLWSHRRWLDCGRHEASRYIQKGEKI